LILAHDGQIVATGSNATDVTLRTRRSGSSPAHRSSTGSDPAA
jgi:hypothetical protein